MKFFKLYNFKGFTLIELLIVVSIIAVVSGVVIAVIGPDRQRSKVRDAARQKDLQVVALALEQYYADRNVYPAAVGTPTNAYNTLRSLLTPQYMKSFPNDPSAGFAYCYGSPNLNNFVLCARQESDPAVGVAQDGTSCTPVGAGTGQYCVSNPL
jgi:prepilin-type N-terminal cleavage/methylation domain-containing protein